jgi:hypothetical protein
MLGDPSDFFTVSPFPGLRLVEHRVFNDGPSKLLERDLRLLCVSSSMTEVGSISSNNSCLIVTAQDIEVKSALAVLSNLVFAGPVHTTGKKTETALDRTD